MYSSQIALFCYKILDQMSIKDLGLKFNIIWRQSGTMSQRLCLSQCGSHIAWFLDLVPLSITCQRFDESWCCNIRLLSQITFEMPFIIRGVKISRLGVKMVKCHTRIYFVPKPCMHACTHIWFLYCKIFK